MDTCDLCFTEDDCRVAGGCIRRRDRAAAMMDLLMNPEAVLSELAVEEDGINAAEEVISTLQDYEVDYDEDDDPFKEDK